MTKSEKTQEVAAQTACDIAERPALTVRSLLVALVLAVLITLWIRQTSLISWAVLVGEGAPPIPALVSLLVMVIVVPLLGRIGIRFSRREVLWVYAFLLFAGPMSGVPLMRRFFPVFTTPYYFATPENGLEEIQGFFPHWLAIHDPEAIQGFFEGSATGAVPWDLWIVPLAMWSLFFLAFWTATLCLVALFRRPWTERERLTYPLVELALDMTRGIGEKKTVVPFIRNPLTWIGIGISLLHNGLNIANAFNPAVNALGASFDIGALFTEPPLLYARPFSIAWRPELIGLGYMVPGTILLSVWVSFLLLRLEGMIGQAAGYQLAGLPFDAHQGSGAFLAMGVMLLWLARKDIWSAVVSPSRELNRQEPVPPRWAAVGLIVSVAIMLVWCVAAGIELWAAAGFFSLVLTFSVVYSRIRAETGAPMNYMFPRDAQEMMFEALGVRPFIRGGQFRSLTMLTMMQVFSRGAFQSLSASQLETLRFSSILNWRRHETLTAIGCGITVGMVLAYIMHLVTYYDMGGVTLGPGVAFGGAETAFVQRYFNVISAMRSPAPPDAVKFGFRMLGFGMAIILMAARVRWLRFPFHPLGYAMACIYGHSIWGPLFIVWIVKTAILRLGGAGTYRRLMPLFLGIAVGQFVGAGGVWGIIATFSEAAKQYTVWFT